MAIRSMKLALFALVIVLVCSVYAQATEKSAARIDVGSLSTQEIEEQLQVLPNLRSYTSRHSLKEIPGLPNRRTIDCPPCYWRRRAIVNAPADLQSALPVLFASSQLFPRYRLHLWSAQLHSGTCAYKCRSQLIECHGRFCCGWSARRHLVPLTARDLPW